MATAELAAAGRKVLLLDQEPESNLGGQAFWSFDGLFLIESDEQRLMGIKDSRELAWQDWLGTAPGIRWFPIVGWAERGGGLADGHGNSVPRFHVTWGTGPAVVEPFEKQVRAAVASGKVTFEFRHRVDEIVRTGGVATGVRGAVPEPSAAARGKASSRTVVGDFELRAPVDRGQPRPGTAALAGPARHPAQVHGHRCAGVCGWADAGDHRGGGRPYRQP